MKKIWETEPDIRVLIVVPKNVILETGWYKELYEYGVSLKDIGVFYGAIKEYAKVTITNMQSLHRIALELFDMVVFDECFSGDTKIKYIENNIIKEIYIKDVVDKKLKLNVLSYNFKTKKTEIKPIINWYKIIETSFF